MKKTSLVFMIDSGASCNFMSADLVKQLGLSFCNDEVFSVRLASGDSLDTHGQVLVDIKFGTLKYSGMFHVLPGSVPLILGMSFLGELRPKIDFLEKTVVVGRRKL